MTTKKMLMLVSASAGIAFLSSACGLFESDDERPASGFYVGDPEDANPGAHPNGGRTTGGANLNGGDGGSGLENGNGGPGGYGEELGQDYNGIGQRILNVNFTPVYFDFDVFALPMSESAKVDAVAEYLNSHPGTGVVIEGNCDERGTQEYNRGLGERRAISVKTALLDRGIGEDRLFTQSFGEDRPAVQGSDETAWARNRRADFVPVKLKR